MANRGHPINEATKWESDAFIAMFKQPWEETVALSKTCHHGDITKHNALIDNGRLVLIDWDEAQTLPKQRNPWGNKCLHVFFVRMI